MFLQHAFNIRRADDAFTTCLSLNIPAKVWIFMGLKVILIYRFFVLNIWLFSQENSYQLKPNSDHVIDFKALSRPSKKTMKGLLSVLKKHSSLYKTEPAVDSTP
jgi:hypothetical protein